MKLLFLSQNQAYSDDFCIDGKWNTCFKNADAALLGNTFLYMICQEENQRKQEMIELINSSFILTYAGSSMVKEFLKHLLSDPI